jgi:alkylation response protein AidB-like acyl-CoA dehydrogenase
MPDFLRPSDYLSYRDAAGDILGRHDGTEALTAFGLDELFTTSTSSTDLTPAYAFLEAQGYRGSHTPALALLGPTGCLAPTDASPMLGSRMGRTRLVGIPGHTAGALVVIDHPGSGLIALPDITSAVQEELPPTADNYLTVIDPSLVTESPRTLVPEEQMNGRRATMVARTQLGAAAELLGIIDRLLTDATVYAQQREQFGHAIASYQSMQHLLAWAATDRHQLTTLYDIAVTQAAHHDADPQLARAVKALAGRTLHTVAQAAIQATGAISFTWEYPQHRYHRRGLALDQLAGASADLVAAIGRQVRTSGTVPEFFTLQDVTA